MFFPRVPVNAFSKLTSFDAVILLPGSLLAGVMGMNFKAADARILQRYHAAVAGFYCDLCGTCEGTCSRGVDISTVNRSLMYAEGYREKGRFTPTDQPTRKKERAWAYPVIANGKLYIRDLDRLPLQHLEVGPLRGVEVVQPPRHRVVRPRRGQHRARIRRLCTRTVAPTVAT